MSEASKKFMELRPKIKTADIKDIQKRLDDILSDMTWYEITDADDGEKAYQLISDARGWLEDLKSKLKK